MQPDRRVVAGAGGRLDVQDVEVAVHELVDGGAGARVALFIDLPDQAYARLLRLGERPRTGGHGLGQVVPPAGQRVDTRVHLHPQRTTGEGLDLAALTSRRRACCGHGARLERLAPRLAPHEPVHSLGPAV